MAVEIKVVSLADMAAAASWPDPRDVQAGAEIMGHIAVLNHDVHLTPPQAECQAVCLSALGMAVGRIEARLELNGILEHRN